MSNNIYLFYPFSLLQISEEIKSPQMRGLISAVSPLVLTCLVQAIYVASENGDSQRQSHRGLYFKSL